MRIIGFPDAAYRNNPDGNSQRGQAIFQAELRNNSQHSKLSDIVDNKYGVNTFKGRSCRLRLKAHILDDPLGNPYDGLKVLLGPPTLLALGKGRK